MADIAVSVLAKLKNKANESGRSYQLLCQEGFLCRPEQSNMSKIL